jgi:hypothetical protein
VEPFEHLIERRKPDLVGWERRLTMKSRNEESHRDVAGQAPLLDAVRPGRRVDDGV